MIMEKDSRLCRQVVNTYCNNIKGLDGIKDLNPGCFENKAIGYAGCAGSLETCDWPAPKYNLTCELYNAYLDFESDNALKEESGCLNNATFAGKKPFSDEYYMLPGKVPICTRIVCNENSNLYDTARAYAIVELFLLIYFLTEFGIRLMVSRKVRMFLKHNIVDIVFVSIYTIEYILESVAQRDFKYTVWGFL